MCWSAICVVVAAMALTETKSTSHEQRGQMPHAAITAGLVLAATTGHRPHGLIGVVLVLIVTAGVGYYFWWRRKTQRERDERR
jgi:hypothetical protein